MDEMKNALKGKSTKSLYGMIKRTGSPFTNEVVECLLPPKFWFPQLESYDGHIDPLDHIDFFKTLLNLQRTPDEVMCKSFLTTLKGVFWIWFSKLALSSIANFEQLHDYFVRHFIKAQRHKRLTLHMLKVKQQEGETLRAYVKCFNQAILELDEGDD